ncbi:hypothetical protein M413DRAFT_29822 [Hebeloma cylindrosporum]|uniref:Uncharacterized protein n=1 Tax=Hebeloma cylindrosporum TaxID=76867 RepID=A0A0C3BQE9_HEBCY|nr:hypothetical protein M413DRAFT_29822 [Hebeloma cylindrosporum h7]
MNDDPFNSTPSWISFQAFEGPLAENIIAVGIALGYLMVMVLVSELFLYIEKHKHPKPTPQQSESGDGNPPVDAQSQGGKSLDPPTLGVTQDHLEDASAVHSEDLLHPQSGTDPLHEGAREEVLAGGLQSF